GVEDGSWTDGNPDPRSAALLEKIQSRIPGWLIMREYAGKDYDKVPRVAPLRYSGAPSVQPFEVLVPTDKLPTAEQRAEVIRSLNAGALTLLTVTWDAPQTAWVPEAWKEAGKGESKPE